MPSRPTRFTTSDRFLPPTPPSYSYSLVAAQERVMIYGDPFEPSELKREPEPDLSPRRIPWVSYDVELRFRKATDLAARVSVEFVRWGGFTEKQNGVPQVYKRRRK